MESNVNTVYMKLAGTRTKYDKYRTKPIPHIPFPVDINTKKLTMSPSILEMTKKDFTIARVEAPFPIGLSLPEVHKPSIPSVKI